MRHLTNSQRSQRVAQVRRCLRVNRPNASHNRETQNKPNRSSKEERWFAGSFNEFRFSSVASEKKFGLPTGGRMSLTHGCGKGLVATAAAADIDSQALDFLIQR